MKSIKLPATIANGGIIPESSRNYANAMKVYDGQKVVITIAKPTKTRSNKQNAYLFGGPYEAIMEKTGNDKESIHHAMKEMFAKLPTSGPIPVIESTSKMSTVRFMKYVDDVIQFCAEFLEIYVPLPHESELFGLLEDK
jgi:hypothetical protein